MASKKQRQEATKKRDKRSKIMLVALGVLLVAVGLYEIPSMLAVMNKKPPPGSTYDPGPSSVVPGSLPDIATGAPVAAAAPKTGELVNTDVPPTSAEGQLVTFEVFDTKNPFRPQVTSSPDVGPSSVASSSTPNHAPTSTVPAASTTLTTTTPIAPPATATGSVVPSGAGAVAPTTTTPVAPAAPTVTISVNGAASKVASLGTFPTGSPVFRLMSYQRDSAEIGIVGGSYAAGGQTITLKLGHPITLQNTTDGTQYRLELIKTP